MALTRRQGLGMLLNVDPVGGTTFQNVASIVDGWSASGAKADTSDLSILVDTFKPFGKGQIDPGEMSFMIAYDPADTTSQLLATMLATTGVADNAPNWQVTYYAVGAVIAKSITFRAWLTGMGDENKRASLITCSITLKKSGNPGYATS